MITKKDLERMFHQETGMSKVSESIGCRSHPKEYKKWIENKLIELLNLKQKQ